MNDQPAQLRRLQRAATRVGLVAMGFAGYGALNAPHQFPGSYLFSYVFWLGLSLGCLTLIMIQHLTGGVWGFVTRRFLEAGFMTLPVMALLFIPLLFHLPELYPWARPDEVAANVFLQKKLFYLNPAGFMGRSLFYFAAWLGIGICLRRWSLQQDATSAAMPTVRLRTLSGPGLVLHSLLVTFALVDWVMSTEPTWSSTIFPLILAIGQVLSALALITLVLAWLQRTPVLAPLASPKCFLDLGNLLLAFVMFWTYISFAQFLIIYSGNLPREIRWYLPRVQGSWKWLIIFVAIFHFALPFFLLLFRGLKRTPLLLGSLAAGLLGVHVLGIFWIIAPAFHPGGISLHWLDLALFLGLGNLWVAVFTWNLGRHPLVPQNEPRPELIPQLANAN